MGNAQTPYEVHVKPSLSPVSLIGVLALLSCSSAPAAKPEPRQEANQVIGLWGSEQTFGPWVKGELVVDGRSSEWRARIAGFDVAARADDRGAVTFALPQQIGEF